jgi:menaquinone-dependent protoporphyrinogen oxidase
MTDHAATSDRVRAHAKALVLYASTHGHTAKIATHIADAMRSDEIDVDLVEVRAAADTDPAGYDVVVVGASIHKLNHQAEIVGWAKAHRAGLQRCDTVFFSVSLSAAEDTDAARTAAQSCVDAFCEDTGWTPGRTERIAGCLQYREYDVFTRQLMRLLMKRMGHPTDASHDYDYTDWDAVDRLGREIAELAYTRRLPRHTPSAAPVASMTAAPSAAPATTRA